MQRDLQNNSQQEHEVKSTETSGAQGNNTQDVTTALSGERRRRRSQRRNARLELTVRRESYANTQRAQRTRHHARHFSRHISNQEFVSAKFRFYAVEQDVQTWSQSSQIPWKHVQKVIVNSDGKTFCPICLETELCCPVVTTCGHIFCGACLLHSIDACNPDQWPKCPCCHKGISWDAAKFCEVAHLRAYEVGDELDLILLVRPENEVDYVMAPQTLESGFGKEHWEAYFQRVRYIRDVDMLFEQDLINLRLQLISGHPVFEQPYLFQIEERILTQIENTKAEMRAKATVAKAQGAQGESNPSSPSKHRCPSRQLYQSQDGQNYFLDNLSWKCLHTEFGNNMPARLSGRIVDIWNFVLNKEERDHHRWLKHLPPLADVSLVELDLSHILSEKTMEIFRPLIEERRRCRIKAEKRENWEKEAAIRREEKESLERLSKQYRLPTPFQIDWQEAPKISDEKAFPTLKQHPLPPKRSQQTPNVPRQFQQPALVQGPKKGMRPAQKLHSMSKGQVGSSSKKPVSGSWGQRPKIGAKMVVASRRNSRGRKLNVKTTGIGSGKKIVTATEVEGESQYKPPTQMSLGAACTWRRVAGGRKRKQKPTKE